MVFVSESMDNKENRTFFPLSMQQIQVKKQLTNILSYRGNSMRRCSKNSSAHISIMTTLKSQHTKGKFGTNGDDSDTATDCVSSIGITILQGRIDTTYQLISHSFGFPGLTQKIAKDI